MNLLYIIVDNNINFHLQASFSIYSFLDEREKIRSINIITDFPDLYQHLKDVVNVITIDENTIRDWKGKDNFFWRVKLKGIEKVCALYPDSPVLYLDTDTFLHGNFARLEKFLKEPAAVMHERETTLFAGKSKTEKRMWASVGNKFYGGVKILPAHHMWNAGVVGTPNTKNGDECRLAITICDEMCEQGVTRRLIEQFSLSVALHETYGLKEAREMIAHYWSNKDEWNKEISTFFTECFFKGYEMKEIIRLMKEYNFATIPLNKKTPSIKRKVARLMTKFFPDKNKLYIKSR